MNPLKKIFNAYKQNRQALEISGRSACGRMCDYCPQSEYNFSFKKIDSENSKLTLSKVIKIQKNIPIDTVIHWTGFVESCIHCEYYLPFTINNSFYKKIARYTPDIVKDYVNKYRNKTAI